MKNLSLYVDQDTLIHCLNPLTKIIYAFTVIFIPLLVQQPLAFAITIAMSLFLLCYAKAIKQVLPLLLAVSFLLLTVLIIQSLFGVRNQTELFRIGNIIVYQEGFVRSCQIILNVINLVLAFGIFILTTKPSTMTEAITSWGLSPKIAYVFGSVFQIIPELGSTMGTIMDAQKSRGTQTEGNLFIRIKAIIPLISPVIMNALVSTKERAIALEVRGFSISGKRTYLNNIANNKIDKIIDGILLLMLGCTIVWRISTWLL